MTNLPIRRMTLYKHGVGFFERRGPVNGETVELTFRADEMNDILKSLVVVEQGGGKVLGVEYPTPRSPEELLAGCSVRLEDEHSLRSLLVSLRGRSLALALKGQGGALRGSLLGVDLAGEDYLPGEMLVSLLAEGSERVHTARLAEVQSVEILDERGARDLRFFLGSAARREDACTLRVRLTPGNHDLAVSYLAAAPAWRVSYRLALESGNDPRSPKIYLLGWGIFDNNLEENLDGIQLCLTAGMPISFTYNLYHPHTPERPEVEGEERTLSEAIEMSAGEVPEMPVMMMGMAPAPAAPAMAKMSAPGFRSADLQDQALVQTSSQALGELFQYRIETPVTVGRGQSAMAPILTSSFGGRKELVYNAGKYAGHPIATLKFHNESGLTLERGPLTVIEDGEYLGEAVFPFTPAGGEARLAYAVELGVSVQETSGSSVEMHRLALEKRFFLFEEWQVQWRRYALRNTTARSLHVVVEHPRRPAYQLFDSPEPLESLEDMLRFEVEVPAGKEVVLEVKERRLTRRHEELLKQSAEQLARYLKAGWLDAATHARLGRLMELLEREQTLSGQLKLLDAERKKLYDAQEAQRSNLKALKEEGKEGELRAGFVERLAESERKLDSLAANEQRWKGELEEVQQAVEKFLKSV